jgi:hypothetical protein
VVGGSGPSNGVWGWMIERLGDPHRTCGGSEKYSVFRLSLKTMELIKMVGLTKLKGIWVRTSEEAIRGSGSCNTPCYKILNHLH